MRGGLERGESERGGLDKGSLRSSSFRSSSFQPSSHSQFVPLQAPINCSPILLVGERLIGVRELERIGLERLVGKRREAGWSKRLGRGVSNKLD